MIRRPRALRPGDRLAIVAPASPFKREEFERGVEAVRDLGFVPVFEPSVFDSDGYVAGSSQVRAAALRAAWCDPTIAGVIAARGGYGSAQLLPWLDASEIRDAKKVFIGYSDVTSLLTFISLSCGTVAFHGPMLVGRLSRGAAGYDRASLLAAVSGRTPMGELPAPGLEAIRPGEVRGPMFGGTITQLLASLGTPFAFDPPAGFVLWLDEVRERPYRLDRMVTQLTQAGVLAKAAGVVIGDLPGCDEPGGTVTARGVMARLFADFPGPVLIGFPSGHTDRPAMTLPLGVGYRIVAGTSPTVVVEEAAVE